MHVNFKIPAVLAASLFCVSLNATILDFTYSGYQASMNVRAAGVGTLSFTGGPNSTVDLADLTSFNFIDVVNTSHCFGCSFHGLETYDFTLADIQDFSLTLVHGIPEFWTMDATGGVGITGPCGAGCSENFSTYNFGFLPYTVLGVTDVAVVGSVEGAVVDTTAVPEPANTALVLLGLLLIRFRQVRCVRH